MRGRYIGPIKGQRVLFVIGTTVYCRDFVAMCLTVAYRLSGEADL